METAAFVNQTHAMDNPVQLNIRIPSSIKQKGDEVLRRSGYSASDVVRSVWAYMADKQRIPDCVCDKSRSDDNQEIQRKLACMAAHRKITEDFCRQYGIAADTFVVTSDVRKEKEAMYEMMLEAYEALGQREEDDAE